MMQGEEPYCTERQSIYCNAPGGYVVLSFKDSTAAIEFDDDIDTVASKLSALVGKSVAVVGRTYTYVDIKLGDIYQSKASIGLYCNNNWCVWRQNWEKYKEKELIGVSGAKIGIGMENFNWIPSRPV